VEFRADGTLVELLIGRGDAPVPGPAGRWDATGTLARASGESGRVVSASPDRLEIAWG
jgi:hypothetical protein